MAEAVELAFEAPTGEMLRFEWRSDELAELGSRDPAGPPVWHLAGELDWGQVDAVRVFSASLEDGRLIAIAALRPAGSGGHGDDLVAGALGDGEHFDQLEEALLSTEYGADGMPRRVGLELYPSEDTIPVRLAGEAQAVATASDGGVDRVSASFALRAGGEPGSGALDLLRRA